MNILLVGGKSHFLQLLIEKLNKAIAHVNAFYERKKNELLNVVGDKIKAVEPEQRFINEIKRCFAGLCYLIKQAIGYEKEGALKWNEREDCG